MRKRMIGSHHCKYGRWLTMFDLDFFLWCTAENEADVRFSFNNAPWHIDWFADGDIERNTRIVFLKLGNGFW